MGHSRLISCHKDRKEIEYSWPSLYNEVYLRENQRRVLTRINRNKKTKPKGVSRKAAKNTKEIFYLGLNTNDFDFLCALGDFARNMLFILRRI
jgi:transcription initiation factor IIE alpha subunit